MSADINNIHLTDERFAELSRAAQAQGKTPDDLADEAIAILLRKRRRSGRVPGRCVHSPDSTTFGPTRYGLHACFYRPKHSSQAAPSALAQENSSTAGTSRR